MARASRRTASRARGGVTVNFEGVESRWMGPERSYLFAVVEGGEYEDDQIKFTMEVVEPAKYEGKKVAWFFSTKDTALWKLRAFLDALGVDTPDSEYELDFESYKDMECGADMIHHEYEGNVYFRPSQFFPAEDYEPEEGDDEAEAAPSKKEVKEKVAETRAARPSRREQEEEPAPARRGRGRPRKEEAPARGRNGKSKEEPEEEELELLEAEDVNAMSEDELVDVVDKYELDIDLDKARTLKRKAAMVVDALEAGQYLAA